MTLRVIYISSVNIINEQTKMLTELKALVILAYERESSRKMQVGICLRRKNVDGDRYHGPLIDMLLSTDLYM